MYRCDDQQKDVQFKAPLEHTVGLLEFNYNLILGPEAIRKLISLMDHAFIVSQNNICFN